MWRLHAVISPFKSAYIFDIAEVACHAQEESYTLRNVLTGHRPHLENRVRGRVIQIQAAAASLPSAIFDGMIRGLRIWMWAKLPCRGNYSTRCRFLQLRHRSAIHELRNERRRHRAKTMQCP